MKHTNHANELKEFKQLMQQATIITLCVIQKFNTLMKNCPVPRSILANKLNINETEFQLKETNDDWTPDEMDTITIAYEMWANQTN